jgi:transcriptional regulator with XRE-family HTH domain
MPEIGTTLREARMRQRIDISEIESETKIRAKYLRALENEEWNLLPGPTYVKSFLRTYADALGLDGRLMVEEYKLRHERLSDIELQPISPPRVRDPRGPRRRVPRGWLVAIVVLGLIAALAALGSNSDNAQSPSTTTPADRTGAQSGARQQNGSGQGGPAKSRGGGKAKRAKLVRLQIIPTAPVFVCLEDAGGRRLVNGTVVQPGAAQPTYRSTAFKLTLGNGNARLHINGRTRAVPNVTSGIGYEITRRHGRRLLSAAQRPTCAG